MSFVKFAYNRAFHSTSHSSYFEVVYGFHPLMPLDLLPIPSNIFVSEADRFDQNIAQKGEERIEKQNFKVASTINKGRKKIIFQPGDCVWIHFYKERFPSQRKTKLHPRGDDPYQVLERINNNAYKMIFLENFQHILLSMLLT